MIQVPFMQQPQFTPVQFDYPYFNENHTCLNCIQNDFIFCIKSNSTQNDKLLPN
jgi:hypothetical protein